MHSSHPIHRALVTFSNSTTGEIRVKIPALLGADSEVSISYIGRKATNAVWVVPNVGDQIVVSSDDTNLTNVFWLQTDQSSSTVSTSTVSTSDASKANIDSPTFTGTVTLPSTTSIGAVSSTEIGYVDGVTSAIQTQLNAKAPLAGPTFTGTVSGITKAMVGLGSADNTADTSKPVSTAQQTALNLKANLVSPSFTGGLITVSGTGTTDIRINAAAGSYARQFFAINGTDKWHYEITPSGGSWALVESGVAQRMTVNASTGNTTFTGSVSTPTVSSTSYIQGGNYGNIVRSAAVVVPFNTSNQLHLVNMPSGCTVHNLINVHPTTGVNNTVTITEVRYGDWSGVQNIYQIGLVGYLGNGVHLESTYVTFFWIA